VDEASSVSCPHYGKGGEIWEAVWDHGPGPLPAMSPISPIHSREQLRNTITRACISPAAVQVCFRTCEDTVMNSDLLPVGNFPSRFEAERAQQILEASGITSMLRGGDASGWAPHLGFAAGGITLFVEATDLEEAKRLLEESNQP
jgi:hypothetical protein